MLISNAFFFKHFCYVPSFGMSLLLSFFSFVSDGDNFSFSRTPENENEGGCIVELIDSVTALIS